MNYSDILVDKSSKVLSTCFHCGEQVPKDSNWTVCILGIEQPMCCPGCQAVAETIIDYGLENFYKHRDSYQKKGKQLLPDDLQKKFIPYNNPEFQKDFINQTGSSERQISLILEGVVCPACIWLNTSKLQGMDGILSVTGNYTNSRLNISWDNSRLPLSEILRVISSLGYTAFPYHKATSRNLFESERKSMLIRIGVAGVLGMQVMMIAFALYASDPESLQPAMRSLLYWLSCFLTVPVIVYSGKSFFAGALRDVRCARTGMDIPVALGISIAFIGSLYNTVTGHEHIYYDSVVMFIFFLLTGRYLEFMSRRRAFDDIDSLNRIIPATTTLITGNNIEKIIPVSELMVNNIILVLPGETFPADGNIKDGSTIVDESILTGESQPLTRNINDKVIAGSINIESPVKVEVSAVGDKTVQAKLCHLIEESQQQKPRLSVSADYIASWFVFLVLIIAGTVAWYWWHIDHDKWLPITVSVLVVACPCALSLATPTAVTVATSTLMKTGIAVKRSDSIENLAGVTDFVFDKTGTLTLGKPRVVTIECQDDNEKEKYLAIAAAMERLSEHPIAEVICSTCSKDDLPECKHVTNKSGYGLSAEIEGVRYFIGSIRYINNITRALIKRDLSSIENSNKSSVVLLANENKILCKFVLEDTIRPGARNLIEYLNSLGINTAIISGDRDQPVQNVAEETGISTIFAGLDPGEKLETVNNMKLNGARIAVVGDGINDAPILASAHVSIAMGAGTDLAKLNSDMILMNDSMDSLHETVSIAYRTLANIRQNIAWAIAYNIVAIPVAAAGLIAPWMAALGMSLSSLVVIGNASRLSKT